MHCKHGTKKVHFWSHSSSIRRHDRVKFKRLVYVMAVWRRLKIEDMYSWLQRSVIVELLLMNNIHLGKYLLTTQREIMQFHYLSLRIHRKLVGSSKFEALWARCSCFDALRHIVKLFERLNSSSTGLFFFWESQSYKIHIYVPMYCKHATKRLLFKIIVLPFGDTTASVLNVLSEWWRYEDV